MSNALPRRRTQMGDFQINDGILQKEAREIAADIFEEFKREHDDPETWDAEDYRGEMSDRAHEAADMHEWVIYTYKAHQLCANCNTDMGEEFLEDVGVGENPTYDSLGIMIAYGELRARIEEEISELIEGDEAEGAA